MARSVVQMVILGDSLRLGEGKRSLAVILNHGAPGRMGLPFSGPPVGGIEYMHQAKSVA